MRIFIRHLTAAFMAAVLLLSCLPASADIATLPYVTKEMTDPAFWARKALDADRTLISLEGIEALNRAIMDNPDCHINDLTKEYKPYNGKQVQRNIAKEARNGIDLFTNGGYYGADGEPLREEDFAGIIESIENADAPVKQEVRYGICTTRSPIRGLPTNMLVSPIQGDLDTDQLALCYLRVNEPCVIRAQTDDGKWYLCDTFCLTTWTPAENIAICRDRDEWLNAWQIPQEEVVVVTDSKIWLAKSNMNSASSGRMLPMGTVLRRVSEADFDLWVTNRAVYYNIPVWLPVRDEAGYYTTTMALIPQHAGVSEGYLPLTVNNILDVAFGALGSNYGWGGFLDAPDCGEYVRDIYKCFGLEMPMNSTWSSAMPVKRIDLESMSDRQKKTALDMLPAGSILIDWPHVMLYLGAVEGRHYAINAMQDVLDKETNSKIRLRSVIVNSVEDTFVEDGRSWLELLNLAIVPYIPE